MQCNRRVEDLEAGELSRALVTLSGPASPRRVPLPSLFCPSGAAWGHQRLHFQMLHLAQNRERKLTFQITSWNPTGNHSIKNQPGGRGITGHFSTTACLLGWHHLHTQKQENHPPAYVPPHTHITRATMHSNTLNRHWHTNEQKPVNTHAQDTRTRSHVHTSAHVLRH